MVRGEVFHTLATRGGNTYVSFDNAALDSSGLTPGGVLNGAKDAHNDRFDFGVNNVSVTYWNVHRLSTGLAIWLAGREIMLPPGHTTAREVSGGREAVAGVLSAARKGAEATRRRGPQTRR